MDIATFLNARLDDEEAAVRATGTPETSDDVFRALHNIQRRRDLIEFNATGGTVTEPGVPYEAGLPVLRTIAAKHSDHPDYDPAWRVS